MSIMHDSHAPNQWIPMGQHAHMLRSVGVAHKVVYQTHPSLDL